MFHIVMVSLEYAYKNGYYIPFLYPFFYWIFKNHLLTSTIILKMLAVNYFFHFGSEIPSAKYCTPLIKPFMRLTDTGYIATFLSHYQPELFPIAFNVHMVIAIAYWIAIAFCNFSDVDSLDSNQIDNVYCKWWSYAIHTIPAVFYFYNISKTKQAFNFRTFANSIGWVLIWFVLIYIPWRLFTDDPIYNILGDSYSTGFKVGITFLVFTFLAIVNLLAEKYQLVTGSLILPYKSLEY